MISGDKENQEYMGSDDNVDDIKPNKIRLISIYLPLISENQFLLDRLIIMPFLLMVVC